MSNDVWVVAMPKLGETVTEGTVGSWLKQVGDTVAFDDPLFEVSTDKVDSEIPSPYDGEILEILVAAGETVPVGTPLVRIGAPGAQLSAEDSPAGEIAEGEDIGVVDEEPPAEEPHAEEAPDAAVVDAGAADTAQAGGEVHEVTMPKLGETVTEGTVGSWLKAVGDTVAFDDPLFEVSTDKVDSEIPSPYDGVVLEILVQSGDTVPVGTPLVRIGEAGATSASAPAAPSVNGSSSGSSNGSASAPATAGVGAPLAATGSSGRLLSPVVRRLAQEHGLDLSSLTGSGASGRVRREDVERTIAAGPAAAPTARTVPAAPSPSPAATPPAATPSATTAAARAASPAVAGASDPRDVVQSLSRMRLSIAAGMKQSQNLAAHVWTSVEVDFYEIDKVRATYKESFKKEVGASLTYLPFVARAVCDALREFPAINSSIDVEAKTMTTHPYVNLGIAVDLDEQGLVVPVVRDADSLNIRGIAKNITTMAGAARSKKLGMADMTGSTFTITNPGPFASYASFPVINQPNVAILCTDGVTRRPVAVGDAIAIHPMGIIGLVYDHRAFDGSTASKFLLLLRNTLQDRDWSTELA